MRRAPDMRSRGVRRSPVQRKGNGTFVPTGRETGAGSMRSAARGWGATGLGGQLGGKVSAFSIGRVPRVGGSGLTGAIRLINRTVFAPRMLAAAVREGRPTLRPFVVRLGTLATTGTLAGVLALAASGTAFAANPPPGTGQPNQACGSATAPNTPGNSASAYGSAFNPDGQAGSVYAGQQPQNSNNPKAVSQYDVACF